jgi:hypothetical protein
MCYSLRPKTNSSSQYTRFSWEVRGVQRFSHLLCLALSATVATATFSKPILASSRQIETPFTCSVPIIDPLGNADASLHHADLPETKSKGALPTNGMSNIDFFRGLQTNFSLDALFTLPLVPTNKGLFYSNWILLKSWQSKGFVQLEIMRWKKYGYRSEIGLTWAVPGSHFDYRDTAVFLSARPHRLGISVSDGVIRFAVDGKSICSAPLLAIFPLRSGKHERLLYQIGTEVEIVGDHPSGEVWNIRLKRDWDATATSPKITCIYRGYGVSWEPSGGGAFAAAGVFDSTEPYYRFTGVQWDEPCRF